MVTWAPSEVNVRNVTSKRREWNNWASTNVNFKKRKLEARINFGYNKLRPFEGHFDESHILIPDIKTNIDGSTIPIRTQFIYGGGLFYKINEGDYISVDASFTDHADSGVIESTTEISEANFNDSIFTQNFERGERGRMTTNFNYSKALKSINGNLFVGGQFSRYFRNNNSLIRAFSETTGSFFQESRDQDFSVDATAIRLDYEKNMENGARWETGINISNIQADALSKFGDLGKPPSFLSEYDYNENNFAGYVQYSNKLNKLSYSLGLRAEKNIVQGKFVDVDGLEVDRDRFNLFPVVNVSYPIDSTSSLTFDYKRTIQRPHFLNATTISTFIGPVNEYSRNINLQSSINDELSLTYQFGRQSISFRYGFTQLPTFTLPRWDEIEGRIFTSPENWESSETFRLVYACPLEKNKWRSTFYIVPTWSIVKEGRAEATNVRPFVYVYNNTSFKINKHMRAGLTIWGLPDRNDGVSDMKSYYVLGASFQHKIDKNFSLTFNANDILKQWTIVSTNTVNDIFFMSNRFTDLHEFSLTLNFKFGKQFKSGYKNKDIDDNLKRI